MEIYINTRQIDFAILPQSFLAVLSGNTWAHMWYLYMLVGLYLITPLIQKFVNNTTDTDLCVFMGVLFVFNSVFPFISDVTEFTIGFYLPAASVYILYYVLGYAIQYRSFTLFASPASWAVAGIASLAVIAGMNFIGGQYTTYHSPLVLVVSVAVFLLNKKIPCRTSLYAKTKYLSFAIYLVHPFFTNLLYKFLDITPLAYPAAVSIPVFFICIFMLSLLVSFLLNRIPPLKKYVL